MVLYGILAWASHDDALRREESGGGGGGGGKGSCKGSEGGGSRRQGGRGLAEAASWIQLRRAIYVSIVREQRIDIPPRAFEGSAAVRRGPRDGTRGGSGEDEDEAEDDGDDKSVPNRVVYLFGRILQMCIPARKVGTDDGSRGGGHGGGGGLAQLEGELDAWYEARLASFVPGHWDEAHLEGGRPFTLLYMIAGVPEIVSQLQRRNALAVGYGYAAAKARAESQMGGTIARHLGILMALALANDHAKNAFYLPAHMLYFCGYCISHTLQRKHALLYLDRVQQAVQWRTGFVKKTLREQWAEFDGVES
ncbi:hypothetical protein PLICBS_006489 [Purpureocillium lilacinum]|uniref:uncharacterized protein n=1 Tax=Purpureocillium lilacinum TaxID=33203 RepID=UPI002085F044|nr:hypothetical protein PLICBS_006489 [Purpureocillium lilacinum]